MTAGCFFAAQRPAMRMTENIERMVPGSCVENFRQRRAHSARSDGTDESMSERGPVLLALLCTQLHQRRQAHRPGFGRHAAVSSGTRPRKPQGRLGRHIPLPAGPGPWPAQEGRRAVGSQWRLDLSVLTVAGNRVYEEACRQSSSSKI